MTAAVLTALVTTGGCGTSAESRTTKVSVPQAAGETSHTTIAGDRGPGDQPDVLPGLGPRTRADIPDHTRQALVVTGSGRNSWKSKAVLYERTDTGWQAKASWPARNALRGWTADHRAGDLRSPVGVFTLSDAGGRLADPGSRLPYSQSPNFRIGGTGFAGEPLAGSFDYVIAIDYNRERGTSPLDPTKPLGAESGGGIWIHVDHGGPTHGCVSLSRPHVERLLRLLDPARHPVVVMGDAASLAT
ncbi:L,D-transpeptidase family protein [Streptomyces sp. 4503]|uniref:L,D-transpeptidase family protein n=1 Tax=Streptomyces niphimycinicus TaxID=2842201 RepID=A0ABS6CAG3_9ACTN|nr:L,D-transpeptidase family protein [Streptomyces niphimycinicus]